MSDDDKTPEDDWLNLSSDDDDGNGLDDDLLADLDEMLGGDDSESESAEEPPSPFEEEESGSDSDFALDDDDMLSDLGLDSSDEDFSATPEQDSQDSEAERPAPESGGDESEEPMMGDFDFEDEDALDALEEAAGEGEPFDLSMFDEEGDEGERPESPADDTAEDVAQFAEPQGETSEDSPPEDLFAAEESESADSADEEEGMFVFDLDEEPPESAGDGERMVSVGGDDPGSGPIEKADEAAQEEGPSMEEVAAGAAMAAAGAVAATTSDSEQSMAKLKGKGGNGNGNGDDDAMDVNPVLIIGALVILLLSFVMGGYAVYQGMSISGDIAMLNDKVANLESRIGRIKVQGGQDPRVGDVLSRLDGIASRVEELAVIIEGPMSHLQESNENVVGKVTARLDEIERRLGSMGSSKPLAKPAAKKSEPKPAESSESKPASGDWVVNLLSLTDEAATDQELKRIRGLGIDAVKTPFQHKGKTWYRVQVVGFADYDEAKAYAEKIKGTGGLDNLWVTKIK